MLRNSFPIRSGLNGPAGNKAGPGTALPKERTDDFAYIYYRYRTSAGFPPRPERRPRRFPTTGHARFAVSARAISKRSRSKPALRRNEGCAPDGAHFFVPSPPSADRFIKKPPIHSGLAGVEKEWLFRLPFPVAYRIGRNDVSSFGASQQSEERTARMMNAQFFITGWNLTNLLYLRSPV